MVSFLQDAAKEHSVPAASLCVIRNGQLILSISCGTAGNQTVFDLASVTKLFTTTAFFRLMDQGKIRLDDPVSSIFPEFSGPRKISPFPEPLIEGAFRDVSRGFSGIVNAETITFRQLLTHSSGLPAWLPLYKLQNAAAIRSEVLNTDFSYEPDTDVVYSDLGLIITGWAIEKICGKPLDQTIAELVTVPLCLKSIHYRRISSTPAFNPNIAPTDICHWRKYRLTGEVEDENCASLDGVTGHAGLFGCAEDLAALGDAYLKSDSFLSDLSRKSASGLFRTSSDGNMARGIGFQHWAPDASAFYAPFSPESFGHTGFTGTALWVDPVKKVSIALLSNEVYNGRYDRQIIPFRRKVYACVAQNLEVL